MAHAGVHPEVKIRSGAPRVNSKYGVCFDVLGHQLAAGNRANIGTAVGIIAAQSIGEPGTQLTLANLPHRRRRDRGHHSRVCRASRKSSKRANPRVRQRSWRPPERCGWATSATNASSILPTHTGEEREYEIPPGTHLLVQDGQHIEMGDQLNEGSLNPHDILRVKGETALQNYLVQEVQKVYRSQGVDINDKHIEVIVRSMLRKVKIVEGGDTMMLPGR